MLYETNYLEHHGIKGQKWGTRRFQNEDGTLTAEGKDRYGRGNDSRRSGVTKGFNRFSGVYDNPDGTKRYQASSKRC